LHRGTLVPIVAGVFAILVAAPAVLASTSGGVAGAGGVAGGQGADASGVRAQEWWLPDLNAEQAWRTSKGTGITVAVLSTGVSADQPDLAGDVSTGPDYTASGRYPGGPYWGVVGTAVASIIAGHGHGTGDGSGIIGIAPQAKILSVRVTLEYNDPLNATAAIPERLPTAIADGIDYAVSHGAKVIDLPLDPGTFGLAGDSAAAGGSPAEEGAVRYALSKGVVLIAPAGDNGAVPGQASYPAAYAGVVAVGATGRDGQLASFSNRDSYVSLTAPGVRLMAASMLPSQSYGYVPGYAPISTTSAASAMVTGVAALVVSKYPQLTVTQVVRALRASATAGSEVNAARALSVAATLNPHIAAAPTQAPAPVKPHRTAHATTPAGRAPTRATASTLASRVLRDAVFGVGALIVILAAAILLLIRKRRVRARAAGAGAGAGAGAEGGRGLHEHRRGHTPAGPSADPLAGPSAGQLAGASGGQLAGAPSRGNAPAGGARTGVPPSRGVFPGGALPDTPMTGASLTGDPLAVDSLAAGWPTGADWPVSTGPAEVSHSTARSRPLLTPLPRSLRPKSTDAGSASPPWAPAAEPGTPDAPVPVVPPGWLPGEPGAGVRLPGDMPDAMRTPGGFDGPDLTAPFAGRDVLTQSSLGFAAAPVPADFAVPADVFPPVVAAADDDDDEQTDQTGDPA
jgi:hypothetical protein